MRREDRGEETEVAESSSTAAAAGKPPSDDPTCRRRAAAICCRSSRYRRSNNRRCEWIGGKGAVNGDGARRINRVRIYGCQERRFRDAQIDVIKSRRREASQSTGPVENEVVTTDQQQPRQASSNATEITDTVEIPAAAAAAAMTLRDATRDDELRSATENPRKSTVEIEPENAKNLAAKTVLAADVVVDKVAQLTDEPVLSISNLPENCAKIDEKSAAVSS